MLWPSGGGSSFDIKAMPPVAVLCIRVSLMRFTLRCARLHHSLPSSTFDYFDHFTDSSRLWIEPTTRCFHAFFTLWRSSAIARIFFKEGFLEDVIVAEEWSSENVWSSMERTTDRLIKREGPWDAKKRIAENGYTLFISFIYN